MECYKILTVTYKQVPLTHIQQFVPQQDLLAEGVLQTLKENLEIKELLYINTCNRVTYCFSTAKELNDDFVLRFFSTLNPNINLAEVGLVARYEGKDALRHLFSVAASIDSMVVGEREILGQMRESYDKCKQMNLCGDDLRLAMDFCLRTAKKVYTNTKISEKSVSVVSLAMQRLTGHALPKNARMVMVGAGQTNQLVAKFLKKQHFDKVTIFNRSLNDNAHMVANLLGGKVRLLDELPHFEEGFDVLIVCTAATQAIIDTPIYEKLLQGDTQRKVVIDLSIPHNVDAEVIKKFNIHYIEIEGLRSLAKNNLTQREQEVEKAEAIIEAELGTFATAYQQRRLERVLQPVMEEMRHVKERALQEVFRKELETLDPSTLNLVGRMMDYVEKKYIGIPIKTAKSIITID